MRSFTARFLALAALVPTLALLVVVPGCAKQSEGERCGDNSYGADNEDCDDGLICTAALVHKETFRCCYADGHYNDSRCEPENASTPSVSASGGGSGQDDAGTSGGGG